MYIMKRLSIIFAALLSMQIYAQKAQVWDFGAEVLDETTYENMLTEAEINSWYGTGVAAGSTGVPLPSFTASEECNLAYNTAGASNHRLRTTNKNLTRYDEKSLKDGNGNVYTGYIYSNSGSKPEVYIEQTFQAGDKVEYYAGSNGGAETYGFRSPSGIETTAEYTAAQKIEVLTFYPGETGKYRFYGINEKLVVARIVRTPAQYATVSGSITAPDNLPAGYRIRFTNLSNQSQYSATPDGNRYTVSNLPMGYTYSLSLEGANGFIIASENSIEITSQEQTCNIQIASIAQCTISGSILGLPANLWDKLAFNFDVPEGKIFQPEMQITATADALTYSLTLEQGVNYGISALNVNDYQLLTDGILFDNDAVTDLSFSPKPTYAVSIVPTGATLAELTEATFVFNNLEEEGYTYSFTGTESIALRDGVYSVEVTNTGDWKQMLTSNLRVNGSSLSKTIDFEKNAAPVTLPYRETISVGNGKDYATINQALQAVEQMQRTADQRVTILIEPGNYEEMLRIRPNNITLKNAAAEPSIALRNAGVDIADNAVRITSYYGHGYNYYSMNAAYQWDERTLQVNKENGYASVTNQGGTSSTYWNATVIVYGDNFTAEDIIFENSYNQYISKKESEDILTEGNGSKGVRPADAGNTAVQARSYRERACALAFAKGADKGFLRDCRIVGRQDALYGDNNCRVAVSGGVLMGACDYIFGGMTLVCYRTELAMLLTADNNDVAYLTASKTAANQRGYLFYECQITSALPEQDMAEKETAKAGYFGRPWDANAETLFFNTEVGTTPAGGSLIAATGWNNGLVAAGAVRSYEYGTKETAEGVDNSTKRAEWATVLTEPTLPDGTAITLYNFTKGQDQWDPFQVNTALTDIDSAIGVRLTAQNGILLFSDIDAPTQTAVYTIDGRNVFSRQLTGETAVSLPVGVYIVALQQGGQRQTMKIVNN